ncbi:hypothetical protein ONZ45_g14960 [Pleurotus djamor]|nr:hypothetical protein ONZ45_g14960 [Pleurotus djamor]
MAAKLPLPQPPYPPLVNYVPLHQQRLAPPQPLPTQQQARPQPEQEPAPPVRPQPPLQPNLAQPLPNVDQQRSRSVEEEQVKPSVPADLDAVVQGHGLGQGNNFFYGCNVTFNTGPPRRSRSYGYERQREEVHPYRRSHKDTNNIDNSNGGLNKFDFNPDIIVNMIRVLALGHLVFKPTSKRSLYLEGPALF